MTATDTLPAAQDLSNLDAHLNAEDKLIRGTVRQLVRQDLLDHIPQVFQSGRLPDGFISRAGELGLLGLQLEGYGCAGTSAVAYGLACLELEAPSSMRTTARHVNGYWVLNGNKMWITNGSIADVAVVWASTRDGIRGFLVPRGASGFRARDMSGKLSLRVSTTSELVFDDCRLPDDALLPHGVGLRSPLQCLNQARYGVVGGAVGAARTCYESALEYACTRTQFGRRIAGFQLTQHKLVDMLTAITTGQLLALQLGRLKDSGQLRSEQISLARRHNVAAALDVARSARSVLGANGITLEYPVMRHMVNLESVLTYDGADEIHSLAVGRAITGQSAFV